MCNDGRKIKSDRRGEKMKLIEIRVTLPEMSILWRLLEAEDVRLGMSQEDEYVFNELKTVVRKAWLASEGRHA